MTSCLSPGTEDAFKTLLKNTTELSKSIIKVFESESIEIEAATFSALRTAATIIAINVVKSEISGEAKDKFLNAQISMFKHLIDFSISVGYH